jgi:hypothetical protein
MAMSPVGLGAKKNCAGEGQQQFTRHPSVSLSRIDGRAECSDVDSVRSTYLKPHVISFQGYHYGSRTVIFLLHV